MYEKQKTNRKQSNMWIERETALLSVNGNEPSILPEQVSSTLIWIDDDNSVNSVFQTKCRVINDNVYDDIKHIIARANRKQPEYEFTEAVVFAMPIRTIDINALSQSEPTALVTHFSKIISKATIFSLTSDTDDICTRFLAPGVFHHTFHIWLLFNKIKNTDTTPIASLKRAVAGWFLGRKALKISRLPIHEG